MGTDTLHSLGRIAWRNLWRNARRTAITLVVVGVGVWSVLFFDAFLRAWIDSSKEGTLGLLLGSAKIMAPGYRNDPSIETLMPPPPAALEQALQAPEIRAVAHRLVLPGVIRSEYRTLPVTIAGVVPADERRISTLPGKLVVGRYLAGPGDDSVVIGRHLAERLKTGIGRRVILMAPAADGTTAERSFDVVGLFDADEDTEEVWVFTGLAAQRRFLGLDGELSEITIRLRDDSAPAGPVLDRLRRAAPGLQVLGWRDLSLFLAATDSMMSGFIWIWLGVVFAMMAIGIVNTQLMAVFERSHEFGLLRALGMRPGRVLAMVALESAVLVGLGVLIGAALAGLTLWALKGGIDLGAFARALDIFKAGQVLVPRFDGTNFLVFSAAIWVLGVLVALWPARRAARVSPVEAMRHAT